MSDLIAIILLSLFGSVLSLVGGVIILSTKRWSQILSKYSTSFAAGVLLTVALISLLPESVHMIGESSFLIVLITFLIVYIFEVSLCSLHHHDHGDGCKDHNEPTFMILVGDTIHNFIDGVAIAVSYLVNPGLGVITATSTFLHEIPHEIGDFGVLLRAGWEKRKILIFINSKKITLL